MKLIELIAAERVPIDIDARKVCIRTDLELIHLDFAAGESLARHANLFDVVFYVVEGAGELEVGDEKRQVGQDTAVEVAAGEQRGWSNPGPGHLRILVVKALQK